jgi:NAD(P)-dependent dehydrogenase (short-subunit alcohol dehydrogenase family)
MADNSRVILITGSDSGIGLAIARKFAMEGYRIAIEAPTEERVSARSRACANTHRAQFISSRMCGVRSRFTT